MAKRALLPTVRLEGDEFPRGPWVYGRQVEPPGPEVRDGDLVEVEDRAGRFLGHALFNGASDVRLRWLSKGRKRDLDNPREFLFQALKRADNLRRKTLRLPEVTDTYRVAHAEGDDLPGLIVDRLGSVLVCEYHSLGFHMLRDDITWCLERIYPELRVVHRVPEGPARAEGFRAPEQPEQDEVEIHERGLTYPVVPAGGHKTGWFCDQRDNRARIGELARDRHVLDLCCNAGGFALSAARAGARSVRAVDLDEVALERATRAARMNELDVETLHADAFHYMRGMQQVGHRAELVVLDPHKLVPSRARIDEGLRKYGDLNTLAVDRVKSGGLLASFSCSGAVDLPTFLGMLFAAARRAERGVRLLEIMGAAADHPQRPEWSRSRYLKGALLAVD